MRKYACLTATCALVLLTAASAQQPQFQNAQLKTIAAHNLAAQLQASEGGSNSLWWGYRVQGMAGQHWNCGTVYLDGDHGNHIEASPQYNPEPIAILLHIEDHSVTRVRAIGGQCQLDAGGSPVTWLIGARSSQSAALLSRLASAQTTGALAALAQSEGPDAEQAMERLAAAAGPEKVREKAVFWLGSARGHAGFLALQRLARAANNVSLDRRIAFALSVSPDPGAVDELIRQAKLDPSPRVREQALFWLAQKAGRKAIGAISSAVANDPDTKVKERAVFALSQLPGGQGVPKLIQVAKTNSNLAVRKRAMFWLGQSKDPRALAFFQQILAR
ncbi:MAG: HEAT repeat domain-containing protein [Terriglobales bacterium]